MAFTDLPLRRSIPLGVVAHLVGYVMTVAAVSGRVPEVLAVEVTGDFVASATLGEVFGSAPSPWIVGGWLFYNAQLIPTSVPTADALNGFGRLTNRSLLLAVDGAFLGLVVVPLAAVLAAGYVTVRTGPTYGVRGATYGGASVVLGYLPPLVIGAFVLSAPVPGAPSVASPPGIPTVFVGLLYATVIGAVGGRLGERSI